MVQGLRSRIRAAPSGAWKRSPSISVILLRTEGGSIVVEIRGYDTFRKRTSGRCKLRSAA